MASEAGACHANGSFRRDYRDGAELCYHPPSMIGSRDTCRPWGWSGCRAHKLHCPVTIRYVDQTYVLIPAVVTLTGNAHSVEVALPCSGRIAEHPERALDGPATLPVALRKRSVVQRTGSLSIGWGLSVAKLY
jgi:hypothetical protein